MHISWVLLLAAFTGLDSVRVARGVRNTQRRMKEVAEVELDTIHDDANKTSVAGMFASAPAHESQAIPAPTAKTQLTGKRKEDLPVKQMEGQPQVGSPEQQGAGNFGQKLLAGVARIPHHWSHESAMSVLFGVGMLTIFTFFILDFRAYSRADPGSDLQARAISLQGESVDQHSPSSDNGSLRPLPERSLSVIVLLTSYRFYTGFLGATWVPFLIAREGSSIIQGASVLSTASFMGIAKLIYGFSILLNPFWGLLSDKLAATAPWGGRSVFLLAGVSLAGIGIYGAKVASESHDIAWYLGATTLWMLGEAMADITSETVAPELLPPSQYNLASSVRSMHHLVGALTGYIALIVAAAGGLHWRWLYVAYLGLMFLIAVPTVVCMRSLQDRNWTPRAGRSHTGPILASLFEAYVAPTRYAGGFPRACMCMGVFCLGTGPLFFTLLMLHDLVGLDDDKTQQLHFSCVSITFLLGACITAIWSGLPDEEEPVQQSSRRRGRQSSNDAGTTSALSESSDEGDAANHAGGGDAGAGPLPLGQLGLSSSRWALMFWSIISFGVVCCVMPTVSLLRTAHMRLMSFYIVAFFLGLAFGSTYSRFQACTWSLLPPHVDIANAMGFAAVAKLTGVGLGNFIAGFVLDGFRTTVDAGGQNYGSVGYFVMNWSSAVCVFISAALVLSINRKNGSFQWKALFRGRLCGC